MKLYYQEAGIEIYHGDCRGWDGTADVTITDPPYGVGLVTKTSDYRQSKYFDNGKSLQASTLYQDDAEHVQAMIAALFPRLLSKVPRALVFCGTAALFSYPKPASIGAVYTPNGAGKCSWGFQCVHPILFYGKDPFLADGRGARPNSFRTEQPNREKIDHPCPKPLPWMLWAVNRASRPGETILDPFMGSGTTLRAAKDLGRRAIGIEIEERYCEIAAQRLEQEVLFSPDTQPEHEQLPL